MGNLVNRRHLLDELGEWRRLFLEGRTKEGVKLSEQPKLVFAVEEMMRVVKRFPSASPQAIKEE